MGCKFPKSQVGCEVQTSTPRKEGRSKLAKSLRSHRQIRHVLLVCTQVTRQVDKVVNHIYARTCRLHTGGHMHTSRPACRLHGCRHTGLSIDICGKSSKGTNHIYKESYIINIWPQLVWGILCHRLQHYLPLVPCIDSLSHFVLTHSPLASQHYLSWPMLDIHISPMLSIHKLAHTVFCSLQDWFLLPPFPYIVHA